MLTDFVGKNMIFLFGCVAGVVYIYMCVCVCVYMLIFFESLVLVDCGECVLSFQDSVC